MFRRTHGTRPNDNSTRAQHRHKPATVRRDNARRVLSSPGTLRDCWQPKAFQSQLYGDIRYTSPDGPHMERKERPRRAHDAPTDTSGGPYCILWLHTQGRPVRVAGWSVRLGSSDLRLLEPSGAHMPLEAQESPEASGPRLQTGRHPWLVNPSTPDLGKR